MPLNLSHVPRTTVFSRLISDCYDSICTSERTISYIHNSAVRDLLIFLSHDSLAVSNLVPRPLCSVGSFQKYVSSLEYPTSSCLSIKCWLKWIMYLHILLKRTLTVSILSVFECTQRPWAMFLLSHPSS